MKHTVATCAHLLTAPLPWMLIDAKLDAGTELDATARRPDLGCAQQALGAAERSTRCEA
jgi:hypothetical protein